MERREGRGTERRGMKHDLLKRSSVQAYYTKNTYICKKNVDIRHNKHHNLGKPTTILVLPK